MVEPGNNPSIVNTMFFLVAKDDNTVLDLYRLPLEDEFQMTQAPLDYEAWIVGISIENNNLFLSKQEITIADEMIITPNFIQMTEADLIAEIDVL